MSATSSPVAAADPVGKRGRLALMAKGGIPLAGEWEVAVAALENGDAGPLLKLPSLERAGWPCDSPGTTIKKTWPTARQRM